ncbi:tol-pal system-associated acyl-CoA thioesterase [Ferrimonas aestuarii]|uniref:Tol-pal system-associated acyl-CoA thioesterase n=1 Tax=Ferrimonas aestuarii TaxID=2569539 RepID=A0A4U1BMS4_9GAMM|nr:tol-pal system-associated acyl-CoA thioesterase [Ferrimonas aestuarii]TKB54600.1 tol-pal system-associated acyl-CoA thioesterase [Ferrimonas aestuarii]
MAFQWPIRVYYSDTDAGGVVYHANYLNFFEHARSEMLRQSGFEQDELMQQGVVFVVSNINLDFVRPAKFNQQLVVDTQITKLGGASMAFEQQLLDQDGQVYCQADVKVVCVDATSFKPQPIPKSIKQELARVS